MRRKRVCGILLICLVAAAHAGEPEAATADPARWTDPRGTPSGSHSSRALPVLDPVEEAWSFALPGTTGAPPVHWDGTAYMLCRNGKRRALLAFDLHTGELRARKDLQAGPLGKPVVWDGLVIVRLTDTQLIGYEVAGKSFRQRWKPRLRDRDGKEASLSDPIVIEREVFVRHGENLLKLKPGPRPVRWVARGDFVGRPAVYGSFVFILGHAEKPGYRPSLHIYAYERASGALAAMTNVAWYAAKDPPPGRSRGEITVSPTRTYVRAPAPLAAKSGALPYASVPCAVTKNTVALGGDVGLHAFVVPPSVHRKGLLALEREEESRWFLWKEGEGKLVASSTGRRGLFRHPLPATVLGDIVYFGTWAADIETGEILWKLPVQKPRFAAVPADELVLVVDGTTLRAFRRRTDG
ncbi:MAG: PQQ-binding-like beta-propeller repeat protein [Planctomycetota bacterium]|nr:PQQ-binding-like beta-propeller repeat protein [Planctomycetota bacterium]